MEISNNISVANVLKKGTKTFFSTFLTMLKYAFLATLIENTVSIYFVILDTLFYDNHVYYIAGMALLLLALLPVVYYSVRLGITSSQKLKAVHYKEKFNFRKKFSDSKKYFWKVMQVLLLQLILIIALMVTVFLIGLEVFLHNDMNENFMFLYDDFARNVIFYVSIILSICILYLLARVELATKIICWDVKVGSNGVQGSMKLTKNHFLKKLVIIISANIPTFLLTIVGVMLSIYLDIEDVEGYLGLTIDVGSTLLSIILGMCLYTWSRSMYLALFNEMKLFSNDNKTDDREWVTF